jgi:tetratricopeptide (TPR) repeat protein
MNSNMKKIIISLAIVILLANIALALDPSHEKTLARAKRYAQQGSVDVALEMLQPLLETYPNDYKLLKTFFTIYRDAKSYELALSILDRLKMISIENGRIYLEYADVYLKMNDLDSTRSVMDRYLKKRGGGKSSYIEISQAYLRNGFYNEATQVYLDGRKKLNDSTVFTRELGSLYQRQRQYYQAAREFYNFTSSDSANERDGFVQLEYLIDHTDEKDQLIKAFRDIITENPKSHLAHRVYADLFQKEGNLDSAFENYKIVDQLYNDDGEYLFQFSSTCLKEQDYRMASRVCRYILSRYPEKSFSWRARVNLAASFLKLNQSDSAIGIYHEIISSGFDARIRLEGNYLLGMTFLDKLYQTDSARHYFNSLLKNDPQNTWKDRVLLKIGKSYIVDGELDKADSIYLIVNTKRIKKSEKESVLFERAQIKFFSKEYSEARGLYNLLIGVHPRSLYVNDCLRKILIIDENSGIAVIDLDFYSEAERYLWQNKSDSALARLMELTNRGGSSLSALATFQAGVIYYDREDYSQSFELFTRMLDSFEDSYYSAESQKYLGDLYFYHFNDHEKAREAYRLILENYPNRLLYEYARRQLRKLENS